MTTHILTSDQQFSVNIDGLRYVVYKIEIDDNFVWYYVNNYPYKGLSGIWIKSHSCEIMPDAR